MTYRVLTGCRSCDATLRPVLDLGQTPIANNLCKTREEALAASQFPLELVHCTARDCGLYQLSIAVDAETLYGNYTYATPDNPELTTHYEHALNWLLNLDEDQSGFDFVVEVGSNNGDFIRRVPAKRRLGVDPCDITPQGCSYIHRAFTRDVAQMIFNENGQADLVVARHCLAHIDDVHEVLAGVKLLLAPGGQFYIENAYWIDSMLGSQFDQIYHEHMSYLTIGTVQHLLHQHDLELVDVNFSDVHGGSFMLLVSHNGVYTKTVDVPVAVRAERAWLAQGLEERFVKESWHAVSSTRSAVMAEISQNHVVDAYGAAAKAVTRFAAAKITREHVRQCIDDSPIKQGKFLPGNGIPIVSREAWRDQNAPQPDAVLLTAWNYERSFREREKAYLEAGGRFIR